MGMPDRRKHRGPHPQDVELLAEPIWPQLQEAVADFSWLLSRGYAAPSSLKIVGDRYSLLERQRMAVRRSSCSDQALANRRMKCTSTASLAGRPLWLDGFNVLTTIEAALAGGIVIRGRDGCYRDLASMHGSYRRVAETRQALRQVGGFLVQQCPSSPVHWLLDRPVSNSGRLRAIMVALAADERWSWTVELADNPDRVLSDCEAVVVSADAIVLDRCRQWLNLARAIVDTSIPHAWIVPLSP